MAYHDSKAPVGDAPPPPYSETSESTRIYTPPSPSLISEAPRTPRESLTPSPEPEYKLPPPAAQAPEHAYIAATGDSKTPQPPASAQRARAPLLVSQKNSSISGDWLIFLEPGSKQAPVAQNGPDALLQTTNSRIEAAVWISDSHWHRRVVVNAKTTNSYVNFAVHTQAAGQAVDIYSKTTNSKNSVLLPSDFHGVLKLSTSNNKCVLSESLRRRSVRVPCGPEEKRSSAEWYEIGGPNGPSVAEIRSSNSRVGAGLVGDDVAADVAGEGSCCCM